MDKRNKLWRRQQMARVFKTRMILMPLMVIASFVRMEAIMNILIGLSWQKTNGHKFTKLQELRVVAGCAEDLNMTAKSIRKKLCVLFGNQWSSLKGQDRN